MNKRTLETMLIAWALLSASTLVMGKDYDQAGSWPAEEYPARTLSVSPVDNPLYKSECGACHFAYQPGLLPARSWEKLMSSLDDHFGKHLQLPPDTVNTLTEYLIANASDQVQGKRSVDAARSTSGDGTSSHIATPHHRNYFQYLVPPGTTPLRITEIPYLVHEHQEIPAGAVKENPMVGSLSNCAACHTRADAGSFAGKEVRIPGFDHGKK